MFDLSPPKKLQLAADHPVYEWQKRELTQRRANLMNNPASGLWWSEVKIKARSGYLC
jgi:hypothetical protein